MIIPVSAETFESSGSDDYLFLEINNGTANGILRIDSKIISIQSDVKLYNNDNFKIKLFQDRLLLFGNTSKVTIIDLEQRNISFINIYKIDTDTKFEKFEKEELTILEELEKSKEITGPDHVETQRALEEEAKEKELEEERLAEIKERQESRSKYVLSDKEIMIIIESNKNVPHTKSFNFDLSIVDPNVNWMSNDYRVGNVEIEGTVKDPDGTILNVITGNTTDKGYFAPQKGTSFSTVRNGDYTLEVIATKYFDDLATYSIASILKEFSVYIPRNSNPTDIYPPVGTINILKNVNGTTTDTTPKLILTCNEFNRYNVKTDTGCMTMGFSLNKEFTKFHSYADSFVYPTLELGEHTIYVMFKDRRGNSSVSSDSVIIECEKNC